MSFQHILGHETQISFLREVMAKGKSAHAYIFSGPDGIGKKTVAIGFAMSYLCPNPASPGEGCGICHTCQRIQRGSHPDLLMVNPTGNTIKIQDIRETIVASSLRPLEGKGRVIIIDEADRLTEPAANALLKTLEEPHRRNVFVLITARPYRLPLTVVSRCQHLSFYPLSTVHLVRYLSEKAGCDPAQAEVIAHAAGGSVSRAIGLCKEEYLSFRAKLLDVMEKATEQKALFPLTLLRLFAQNDLDLEEKLDFLITFFRDILWIKETGTHQGVLNVDFLKIIKPWAERLSGPALVDNIRIVSQAKSALEENANKALTLDATLFRLSFP